MNKTKKICMIGLVGLFVLMMTAASVSADDEDEPGVLDRVDIDHDAFAGNETDEPVSTGDEPNLIAPGPDADEEPLIIAPGPMENEDASSADNTTGLILVTGITGAAGLAAAVIILKKKN